MIPLYSRIIGRRSWLDFKNIQYAIVGCSPDDRDTGKQYWFPVWWKS
jgi:hypothetical protein